MAIAYDPEMASAIGANTKVIAAATFALAGMFAGVAGVLIGPITYSNPYLGDTYGIAGFVALMIGGVARPAAAMAGGLVLGVLGEAANRLINPQAADWFPFVVVVVVLLVLPEGLVSLGAPLGRLARRRRTSVETADGRPFAAPARARLRRPARRVRGLHVLGGARHACTSRASCSSPPCSECSRSASIWSPG